MPLSISLLLRANRAKHGIRPNFYVQNGDKTVYVRTQFIAKI